MIIRPDELNRIAIDKFVSLSGLYVSIFCHRYEPKKGILTSYYIVTAIAASRRVVKVVQLPGNFKIAEAMWNDFKQMMTSARDGAVYETDAPEGLHEILWSPPILIQEDLFVLKLRPVGFNIFVRDITPVDEVTARAAEANLTVIVSEENKPMPTMGIVLKITAKGVNPLLDESGIDVGDIVMFNRHAGGPFTEANYTYRHIQLHEILGYRKPEDGLEDVLPPNLPQEMIDWAKQLLATLVPIAESKPIEVVTTEILR
jgi:co-chaperonin GroES (HSP10)